MGMKLASRPLLKWFGHRTILLSNTVLLGLTMMIFTQVDRSVSVPMILLLSFAQGFFASLQFTAMNSLVYADVDDTDASKASDTMVITTIGVDAWVCSPKTSST